MNPESILEETLAQSHLLSTETFPAYAQSAYEAATRSGPYKGSEISLFTRGNVDGITSAALLLAQHPEAKTTFVPSANAAADAIRQEGSTPIVVVDIGLTPRLVKTLNGRAKAGKPTTYIDHHQQSIRNQQELDPAIIKIIADADSAAALVYDHYSRLNGVHTKLVDIANVVETGKVDRTKIGGNFRKSTKGKSRGLESEANILDCAWRYAIEDDNFREDAARALSAGVWPSQVKQIVERYNAVYSDNRWEKALDAVREYLKVDRGVALLELEVKAGNRPSFYGFGTSALVEVARQKRARIAALVNHGRKTAHFALRATGKKDTGINLGLFAENFAKENGIVGGGHPDSAGGKTSMENTPKFLKQLYVLAARH